MEWIFGQQRQTTVGDEQMVDAAVWSQRTHTTDDVVTVFQRMAAQCTQKQGGSRTLPVADEVDIWAKSAGGSGKAGDAFGIDGGQETDLFSAASGFAGKMLAGKMAGISCQLFGLQAAQCNLAGVA